jgi:hypothetical protein
MFRSTVDRARREDYAVAASWPTSRSPKETKMKSMKSAPKKLTLDKSTLRTLAGGELHQIAGGRITFTCTGTAGCPTKHTFCGCG